MNHEVGIKISTADVDNIVHKLTSIDRKFNDEEFETRGTYSVGFFGSRQNICIPVPGTTATRVKPIEHYDLTCAT
jgi:hypothetical protein